MRDADRRPVRAAPDLLQAQTTRPGENRGTCPVRAWQAFRSKAPVRFQKLRTRARPGDCDRRTRNFQIYIYDAEPTHHGERWCVVSDGAIAGAVGFSTIHIPEARFQKFLAVSLQATHAVAPMKCESYGNARIVLRARASNYPVPSPLYSGEKVRMRGRFTSCATRENGPSSRLDWFRRSQGEKVAGQQHEMGTKQNPSPNNPPVRFYRPVVSDHPRGFQLTAAESDDLAVLYPDPGQTPSRKMLREYLVSQIAADVRGTPAAHCRVENTARHPTPKPQSFAKNSSKPSAGCRSARRSIRLLSARINMTGIASSA